MPRIDGELEPGLEWQLRSTLDRVQPPHSPPRYAQEQAARRRGPIAPAVFTAAVTAILVFTLVAAAGARSFDLQRRIVNTIQSGTAPPPGSVGEPSPSPTPVTAVQSAPPTGAPATTPSPAESPEPSSEPGEDGSPSPRPNPSPSPDE